MIIVHVITRFMRGGADENTLLSCNAQAEAGHEIHLIHGGDFHAEMLERVSPLVVVHCVPDLVRPLAPARDVKAFMALQALLRLLKPDIVHTHTSKAGVLGRAAALMGGASGVVHGVHILPFVNVPFHEKVLYLMVEKLFAPTTHAFINVSDGMMDLGLRYGVGAPKRHHVVPSGMAIDQFRRARPFTSAERTDRLEGDVQIAPLLVFVAALEPRKRQYEFLDVMAKVARQVPEARLVFLGEGVDEARLRDRVQALGLKERVCFAGFSNEVERWIASAAVCVFASEREGLPRAVIQYALAAKPVVSTRLPGIEAVVRDGETGVLVEIDAVMAMADPIIDLLTRPGLAESMACAARSLDLSAWEDRAMIDALDSVYVNVLNSRRGKRKLQPA